MNIKNRFYKDLEKYNSNRIGIELVNFSMGEESGLIAYFIPRKYILDNFTLEDLFEQKGSSCPFEDLENTYNTEWFYNDGKLELPEFCHMKHYGDKNIYTLFNIGRHRTIIFLRYMDKIPMLYNKKSSDRTFVNFDIPKDWEPINENTKIEIPALNRKFLGISGTDHCD